MRIAVLGGSNRGVPAAPPPAPPRPPRGALAPGAGGPRPPPAPRPGAVRARPAGLFPAGRGGGAAPGAPPPTGARPTPPPLVLLNTGPIDGGRFDIHAAGTTPRVRRLIDAVDGERVATRTGWRYAAPHYELETYYDERRAATGLYGAGARAKLLPSGLWSETLTFEHRSVTE